MITNEMIERINFLARKQKAEGLTSAEQDEQATLRRQYVDAFKGNLRSQLDNIKPQHTHADGKQCCGNQSCGCHRHDH